MVIEPKNLMPVLSTKVLKAEATYRKKDLYPRQKFLHNCSPFGLTSAAFFENWPVCPYVQTPAESLYFYPWDFV